MRIESLEGGRLTGTFSARLRHAPIDEPGATLEPFDVTEGRFSIDPVEWPFSRLIDRYFPY